MEETVNVNLTVNGYALDPRQTYIIEIKKADATQAVAKGLVNALQQLGVKHVLVATETGEALNVVQVPPSKPEQQEEA